MCLTIPVQIVKLEKDKAIVQENDKFKKIQISSVSNLKVGDWILYINDLALKKIPEKEAKEILELFKPSYQKIAISKLSRRFKEIIQASKLRDLTKDDIIYLLETKGLEKETLFSEANFVRQTYLKDFICIHGIIEFSNFCKNDCLYCGLRKENQSLKRYRMSANEIVDTAYKAAKRGYKLLVLQSGEDFFYTDEILEEIIKKIKAKCQVFIFISIGERGYQSYKRLKKAGASGVLFRFETSNPKLFKKLHLKGKNFKNRFRHLEFMKELGYFIATGFLIGLPGQTIKDLAEDILTTKKWANMVSIGPFVPSKNTPLANFPPGDVEMTLKTIAVLRLMMKNTRIPVTTALETLAGENGRKRALQAGANSLMFHLTPNKYRQLYEIYPNRFFQKESIWQKYGLFKYKESYKMLEERMAEELKKEKYGQN